MFHHPRDSAYLLSWICENHYLGMSDEEIDWHEEQKWEHKKWMEDNYDWISQKRLKSIFGLLPKYTKKQFLTRDEVLEQIDLHDVIIQYTQPILVRDGECMAQCPFHSDSRASLGYNRKKGVWTCYGGCGGGTAIEFVMLAEQVNHNKAKDLLMSAL